MSKIINK